MEFYGYILRREFPRKQEGARHVHHTEVNFYARETRYTAQQTHNLDKDTLSHRLQSALLYSFRDLTFLFCQALHMHGFARALPHGASNNRHQVQYGNWHFAIRRKKSPGKASVGTLFCFGFSVGIHLCTIRAQWSFVEGCTEKWSHSKFYSNCVGDAHNLFCLFVSSKTRYLNPHFISSTQPNEINCQIVYYRGNKSIRIPIITSSV